MNKKYNKYGVEEYYEIVLNFNDIHYTIFTEFDYDAPGSTADAMRRSSDEECELDNIKKIIIEVTEVLISHEKEISELEDINDLKENVKEMIKYRDKLIEDPDYCLFPYLEDEEA